MKLQKVFVIKIFIVLLFTAISSTSYSGIIYQTMNLKDDGSGSIKLNYNNSNSVLRQNNFILANFPFSEKLAQDFFKSPNSTVKTAKLDFRISDSTYFMTIEVDFKDINKLNQAKGFSNVRVLWTGSDSGAVFTYSLLPGLSVPKFFETQSYIVNFESTVKSSNGVVKDKEVTWGSRSIKNTDFSKDVNLIATTTAKIPVVTSASEPNKSGNSPSNTSAEEKKEKSCGLFGFELPLILLAGYVFSLTSKRRKS